MQFWWYKQYDYSFIEIINIFNPKKKLVGGAPLHVKRAETPLSTSFFLGLKCFSNFEYYRIGWIMKRHGQIVVLGLWWRSLLFTF